jgi:hypothetical protein
LLRRRDHRQSQRTLPHEGEGITFDFDDLDRPRIFGREVYVQFELLEYLAGEARCDRVAKSTLGAFSLQIVASPISNSLAISEIDVDHGVEGFL